MSQQSGTHRDCLVIEGTCGVIPEKRETFALDGASACNANPTHTGGAGRSTRCVRMEPGAVKGRPRLHVGLPITPRQQGSPQWHAAQQMGTRAATTPP